MTSDRVIIIHNLVTSDSDQHVYPYNRVADPDTQAKTRARGARVLIKVGWFITLWCSVLALYVVSYCYIRNISITTQLGIGVMRSLRSIEKEMLNFNCFYYEKYW